MASISVAIRYADNMAQLRNNLSQGLDQIEATTAGAKKMADSLGGSKMIQSAQNLVAALSKVEGGIESLTLTEAASKLDFLERSMDKMTRKGQLVPTDMKAMADSLRKVVDESQTLEQRMGKLADKLESTGGAMKTVGATMLPVTALITGVGVAGVMAATSLNESIANVSALLGDMTGAQLDKTTGEMKAKVQDMAVKLGKSTGDIADGLYEVVSSLGYTNDTFGQLEIAAKAGAAGLATTKESFNFLSAVTKTYGDTSEAAFKKAADLGFQAVNFGQTTFPQLAASIGGVAPIAKVAGVSMEEMFAVLATATGVTGGTSEVVTQMTSALGGLLSPSKDMTDMFKAMGIASGEAMIKEFGFVGSLQKVAEYAERTGTPIADLLGRKEGFILTASLAGAQAGKFADNLKAMGQAAHASGGVVDAAFEKQTNGVNKAGFAWKQFKAEAEVAAQKIGDAVLPVLMRAAETLRPLWSAVQSAVTWFGELPAPVQTVGVVLLALMAAAGPVIYGLGQMVQSAGALARIMPSVVDAIGPATMAVKNFATALLALELNPLILGLTLTAGAALILWHELDKGTESMRTNIQTQKDKATVDALSASKVPLTIAQQKELAEAYDRQSGRVKKLKDETVDFGSSMSIAGDGSVVMLNNIAAIAAQTTKTSPAVKKLTDEQVKWNKSVADGAASMNGQELAEQIRLLDAQVTAAGKSGGILEATARKLVLQFIDLAGAGGKLTPQMEKMIDERKGLPGIIEQIDKYIGAGTDLGPVLHNMWLKHQQFNQIGTDAVGKLSDLKKAVHDYGAEVTAFTVPMPSMPVITSQDIAKMLPFGGAVSAAIQKQAAQAADESAHVFQNNFCDFMSTSFPSSIMGAIQGGGKIFSSAGSSIGEFLLGPKGLGGSITKAIAAGTLGKTLGNSLNAILPGVGAMVGPMLDSVMGKIFGKAGRQAVEEFAASMGGFQALNTKLANMPGGEQMWIKLTQGVGRNNPEQAKAVIAEVTAFIQQQEAHLAAVAAAVEKYQIAFADKTPQEQLAEISKGLKGLQADHALLVESGLSTERATRAQAAAYNELIAKSASVGTEMPLDLLKVTRELAQMGLLTEANTRALLGMKDEGVVDWKAMEDAATRYNIPLDQMGDKFRAAKLGDQVRELMADYDLLIGGGVDFNVVIEGMGDKFNSAAQNAARYGIELPANMKPVLDAMLQQGRLTDENGDKLTSLSGIKFGETMAESTQKLLDKLDKLIDALTNKVAGAAADAAAAITDGFTGLEFNIPVNFVSTGGNGVEAAHAGAMVGQRIQRFHTGTARVLPFPNLASDEVPAILQTGEAVLRREAVAALGQDAIEALNGVGGVSVGASGGTTGSNVVDINRALDRLAAKINRGDIVLRIDNQIDPDKFDARVVRVSRAAHANGQIPVRADSVKQRVAG